MNVIRTSIILLIVLLIMNSCSKKQQQNTISNSYLNFSHLKNLTESIIFKNEPCDIIHIYAEYPDYKWVEASGEGIACVDDAARAAVVFLRHYELYGDKNSLNSAKRLVDFCRLMQTENGQFYNFIFADHSINKDGESSLQSFGAWAARGIWAIGFAYRVFHEIDPEYANILKKHIEKSFNQIEKLLSNYKKYDTIQGFKMPKWLIYKYAADATAELMLGLTAYVEISEDEKVIEYLHKFANGLLEMQCKASDKSYNGLFRSWVNIWHAWGNSQCQALAYLGHVINQQKYFNAAAIEAKHFYPYWIKSGYGREIKFNNSNSLNVIEQIKFPQIAYDIRPPVLGCLNLYRASNDEKYAVLAGELASWLFGNNPANIQMYDPKTGRCFDGIINPDHINKNSGAESTIEALYIILEIEANQTAFKKLNPQNIKN